MFAIPPNGYKTEENLVGKRHCILVAANNPYPLPVPVYRPNFEDCGDLSPCHDAETVAGWFGRCSVSLSVISPRRSPKLRALFEAGKHNPNSEDKPIWNQHPNYLVLISEDFKEARAALNPIMLEENQIVISQPHPEPGASPSFQPVELPVSKPYSSEKASSILISGSRAVTETSQYIKNSALSSSLETKCVMEVSSLAPLQSSSNMQRSTTIVGQRESSLNQVTAVKLEGSLDKNLVATTNLGSTDVASRTKIPVLGIPQQLEEGEKPVTLNYSAVSVPVSQETPGGLPVEKSQYVKLWEGNLVTQNQGKAVFINRLEAYGRTPAPATLVADWPDSITVVHTMLLDCVKYEYKFRRAVLLFFRVVDQLAFSRHLLEKKLCAVVELPNQKLLLYSVDKPGRLVGMLFSKDAQTSSASQAATAVDAGASTAAAKHQQG